MNIIRSAVSGRRNRMRDGDFDLDLSYITPRVIAMSFPSTGYESVYRNPITDVARFLNQKHGANYMVFNLSERHYDNSLFEDRVVELGFPDHHSPPVSVAWSLVRTMDAWLEAAPENVAVVHCLAGKGRTGVIIACYLLFSGYVSRVHLAEASRHAAAAAATGAHAGRTGPAMSIYGALIATTTHERAPPLPAPGPTRHLPAGGPRPAPGMVRDGRAASDVGVRAIAGPAGVAGPIRPGLTAAAAATTPTMSSQAMDALRDLAAARKHAHSRGEGVLVLPASPAAHPTTLPSPAAPMVRAVSAPLHDSHAAAAAQHMSAVASGVVNTGHCSREGSTGALPVMPATFCLPPAADMASQVLSLFRSRRGEGVKYPSQERTVRYFARIVHDTLIAEDMALAERESMARSGSTSEPPAGDPSRSRGATADGEIDSGDGSTGRMRLDPEVLRLSAGLARVMAAGETAAPVHVRTAAAKLLRSLKSLPLPRNVPVCVTKFIVNGVPNIPGGFVPLLQIMSQPYQGAETRVIYSSTWHAPVPAPVYYPKDEVIMFQMRALLQGDILVSCRHAPTGQEMFRFSFHTTFMTYEGVPGVYRLQRKDVDMEHRKHTEKLFPEDFFLDMVYTILDDADAATGFADGSLPSRRQSTEVPPRSRAATESMDTARPAARSSVSGAPAAALPFNRVRLAAVGTSTPAASPSPRDEPPLEGPVSARSGRSSSVASEAAAARIRASAIGVLASTSSASHEGTETHAEVSEALTAVEAGRDTEVVCSGWLTKRGAVVKNWKRRWFVLRSARDVVDKDGSFADGADPRYPRDRRLSSASARQGSQAADDDDDGDTEDAPVITADALALLIYYKKPGDAVARGVIPLTRETLARVHEFGPADGNPSKTGGRSFCFVVARGDRKHYLQAEDGDDLQRWLVALERLRTGGGRSPANGRATPSSLSPDVVSPSARRVARSSVGDTSTLVVADDAVADVPDGAPRPRRVSKPGAALPGGFSATTPRSGKWSGVVV